MLSVKGFYFNRSLYILTILIIIISYITNLLKAMLAYKKYLSTTVLPMPDSAKPKENPRFI